MDGRQNNSGKKGNKGGGRKSSMDEYRMKELIRMSTEWAIKQMESNDPKKDSIKKEIALKVLSKAVPQQVDNKMSGDLSVSIVNYANTAPISTKRISDGIFESDGQREEESNSSMAQESWEGQISI